jgi:ABC-type lipoprotein export system ATPase subunit/bifunctional DNA-binding transcriptional regulator/antitoxin component of YhaV-PrlF toxin-antitoxin module
MDDGDFVSCASLVKIYRTGESEVQALQGLDLRVARGELLAMVGPSGSGKSTLLNIIGGLDTPTGGTVRVDGQDLGRMSPKALDVYRSRTVGFVWQKPSRNLLPYLSARENVELPVVMSQQATDETHRWAGELLEIVGLGARTRHTLVQLSGGELQRVAIATALIHRPRLLLADEPTGELDTATSQAILDMLRDVNHRLGITTIIVTHDTGIARQVDRVVAIRDGKTSTEKVRVSHGTAAKLGRKGPAEGPPTYKEYVVLDSAGRLQIPKEMREALSIRSRAELDLVENGVMIRPVSEEGRVASQERDEIAEGLPAPRRNEPHGALQRVLRALRGMIRGRPA